MDWDTFYFEYWVDEHPDEDPTHEDYREWLLAKAELAFGDGL